MEFNLLPRWLLVRIGVPEDARSHVAVLLSTILALLSAPVLIHVPHTCLFQTLLGIPCPGCGILHGMNALLQLDIAAAWHLNPAAFAVVGLALVQIAVRLGALLHITSRLTAVRSSYYTNYCVAVVLILVWIVRILHGGLYASGFMSEM